MLMHLKKDPVPQGSAPLGTSRGLEVYQGNQDQQSLMMALKNIIASFPIVLLSSFPSLLLLLPHHLLSYRTSLLFPLLLPLLLLPLLTAANCPLISLIGSGCAVRRQPIGIAKHGVVRYCSDWPNANGIPSCGKY